MDLSYLKYPIYIISKGRAKTPYTANLFKKENIPFLIAVEPQEYDLYCEALGKEFILKLPFQNLGLGSYPARNFCWEHSILNGFKKHFIFDDNIRSFRRLVKNKRPRCGAFIALLTLQFLDDRYLNLAMSGFNYNYFVNPNSTKKPFYFNTHVYSGILINNEIPFRWRLKYNEDIDLNLQALDGGYNTILLNIFMIEKISTVAKLKGGNQTELYQNNATEKKALKASSIAKIWPQYATVKYRFNRPHHEVLWNKYFKKPLLRKSNYQEIIEEQKLILEKLNLI